jgi:hypothetical protein
MGLPNTLKIKKTILQQTSWAGWQHPDDKWSEAVLDPLPFSGLESYQTWWWSTETNQQQPTDISQKITNAHEQHKLPNNLKWTQVIRKGKQLLPIAIHLCVSIIKSGRTLIRRRAKDLKLHIISVISIDTAPCIVRDLRGNFFVRLDKFWIITLLCKVTLFFFSGYHDIPWAFQTLLKLRKQFYSRHHELVDSEIAIAREGL